MAPQSDPLNETPLTLRQELLRKALHLSAAVFPVAYYLGARQQSLVKILGLLTIVAGSVEAWRQANPKNRARFERLFGSLERPKEHAAITGATVLALSCLAVVGLLSRNAAIAALWCATVGDPFAAIAGRVWTAIRPPPDTARGRKTLVGSAACAVVSFLGVSILAGYPTPAAAVIAIIAAAAEAVPSRLDDNFRVAGAAGLIAQLLA